MKKLIFVFAATVLMALSMNSSAARVRIPVSGPEFAPADTMVVADGYFEEAKGVEFAKWVRERIDYKGDAHGRVVARFSVREDGSVFNVKIQKSIDPQLDEIVKKVILSSPKWKQRESGLITTSFETYSIPLTF
ncbi:MAG: energy transducer TonB [Bacteroidales bacterium]|nr:energy transducer TonB [Bacteroidales bacterium]